MSMALAALFSLIVAGGMAYKMMVKNEPLDVMKLFRPCLLVRRFGSSFGSLFGPNVVSLSKSGRPRLRRKPEMNYCSTVICSLFRPRNANPRQFWLTAI